MKLGFTFDAAPEVNHNCISIAKHNEKMSFGTIGTKHKMIIGENYDALKNLLVTHREKIDVIYIDPPYNTEAAKGDGNDHKDEVESKKFLYRDKFTRNGWLNMMQERLKMARQLLSDTGVIFISIDDQEQAYLKVLCDEIFGEENFTGMLVWKKSSGKNDSKFLANLTEYCTSYRKNPLLMQFNYKESEALYNFQDEFGNFKIEKLDRGGLEYRKNNDFIITAPDGTNIYPGGDEKKYVKRRNGHNKSRDWQWRLSENRFNQELKNNKIYFKKIQNSWSVYTKQYDDEKSLSPYQNLIEFTNNSEANSAIINIFNEKVFDYPKPVALIKHLLKIASKPNSTVLDFFAGSGTTGQAVMELNEEDGGNRQCILVANNENNIGKGIMYERIYRVCNGKGTNGEEFKWEYSKEKKCLENNIWDIFEIEEHELKIDDFEKAEKLIPIAEKQFKLLNEGYESRNLDIYNQLASLNPYKK